MNFQTKQDTDRNPVVTSAHYPIQDVSSGLDTPHQVSNPLNMDPDHSGEHVTEDEVSELEAFESDAIEFVASIVQEHFDTLDLVRVLNRENVCRISVPFLRF